MPTENDRKIDHNTPVRMILPASIIKDGATVTRVTGAAKFILRHSLTVYTDQQGEKPMVLEGTFLFNTRGQVNQIKPDTNLAWATTALDLYEWLVESQIGDENYIEDK